MTKATKDPNIQILEKALQLLGPLADDLVLLGGCATGLLLTDPAAPAVRATRDVDTLIEVATLAEYYQFTNDLKASGFNEDSEPDAPICRWIRDHILLDVMPTDPSILV